MNLLLRVVLFGAMGAGAVLADEAYQRPHESASASAAVAQASGDPSASQRLETLRQRGTWADVAAGGAILIAGVACFATWRPTPGTRVVDHRSTSVTSGVQKESV